ncbi:MAG: FeoB-associated Cys-rich membrane protein [Clostridia bacterium]|nr:FeoB-associated Cys-rich membrane protein [Clostridia bacterium]
MGRMVINMATVIISLLLAAIVAGIIIKMIKNKKAGKSSCGCGCSGCPMSSECNKKP